MTRFLLDTCAISDYLSETGRTKQRLQATSPSQISISAVTTMEIHYGFALKPSIKRRYSAAFHSFCQDVEVLPFDHAIALEAANIRARLKTTGQPIGSWDLLIGATALTHSYILVTSNVREFERIDGLKIENWR